MMKKGLHFLLPVFVLLASCQMINPAGTPPTASPEETTPGAQQSADSIPATPTPTPYPTPVVSGLQVFFVKGDNLWQSQDDGPVTPLAPAGKAYNPALSSDGKVVAFLRPTGDQHYELWAVDTGGDNERRLVSSEIMDTLDQDKQSENARGINPFQFAWVPGTHTLMFNTVEIIEGPGVLLLDDLRLVDADSLAFSTLLPAGEGGGFVFSPDAKQIALLTRHAISLIDVNGENLRPNLLTYSLISTYSEYPYYPSPVWLPDASALLVVIPPTEPLAEPRLPSALWKIPADGSPAVRLVDFLTVPPFAEEPAFSPDVQRLAYLRETGEPAENLRQLYLMNSDGAGETLIHSAVMLDFVSWSPDSRHFLFTVGENQETMLGSVDASFTPLKFGETGASVSWTYSGFQWVDAGRVLFTRHESLQSRWELCLGDVLAPPGSPVRLIDSGIGTPPAFDFYRP